MPSHQSCSPSASLCSAADSSSNVVASAGWSRAVAGSDLASPTDLQPGKPGQAGQIPLGIRG